MGRPGYQLMLITRSFPQSNPPWNKYFLLLYTLAKSKNIPVILVTSNRTEGENWVKGNNLSVKESFTSYPPMSALGNTTYKLEGIPVFGCDATAVKTAARADPTLYLLKKAKILNKWSYANMDMAIPAIAELPLQRMEILAYK